MQTEPATLVEGPLLAPFVWGLQVPQPNLVLCVLKPTMVGPGHESVPAPCARGCGRSTPLPTMPLATCSSPFQPC